MNSTQDRRTRKEYDRKLRHIHGNCKFEHMWSCLGEYVLPLFLANCFSTGKKKGAEGRDDTWTEIDIGVDLDLPNSARGGDMGTECKHPRSTHEPEYEREVYIQVVRLSDVVTPLRLIRFTCRRCTVGGVLLNLERACALLPRDRHK